jgi:hypothetical protein
LALSLSLLPVLSGRADRHSLSFALTARAKNEAIHLALALRPTALLALTLIALLLALPADQLTQLGELLL